jgi:hypothetical protein
VDSRVGLDWYEEATMATTLVLRSRAGDIVAVEKPCVVTMKILLDIN